LKEIKDGPWIEGNAKLVSGKPDGGNFPTRNRIISVLSLGVLVAEAPTQSGAPITAGFALKQGRDIFSIPGSILSSKSSGVNKLIQEGAKPVMEVTYIMKHLTSSHYF
jgi:DNA processing protein